MDTAVEEKKMEGDGDSELDRKKISSEDPPQASDNNDDADVLYDDLADATAASSNLSTTKRLKTSSSAAAPRSLVEEVEYLQQRVESLQHENTILKRNMGTLYRTARAEIQRKDQELERLALLQMPSTK